MRALRYYGLEDIRLDDIPEPDCRPGCVKIRPEYVGICGSDMCVAPVTAPVMFLLHIYLNTYTQKFV